MDRVFIEGLELRARIGAWEWERQLQQRLRLDLELGADTRAAAASDALEDAVSYSAVAECLCERAATTDYRLLRGPGGGLGGTPAGALPRTPAAADPAQARGGGRRTLRRCLH
ncbi:MAG: dihydroneopterin aldolase [Arhodomonas sp.]|nr:dihydroneopterin aldolase [Arhodomonas sp.]